MQHLFKCFTIVLAISALLPILSGLAFGMAELPIGIFIFWGYLAVAFTTVHFARKSHYRYLGLFICASFTGLWAYSVRDTQASFQPAIPTLAAIGLAYGLLWFLAARELSTKPKNAEQGA